MKAASRYTLFSQLALLVSIFICVLISPEVLFSENQGGVSNYGTMSNTFVVFSIGFWICAILLTRAATAITLAKLKRVLVMLGIGYGLLVLSTYPYKLNVLFENIHIVIAFGLLFFQLGLGFWLAKLNDLDRFSKICLAVQLVSLGLGVLTALEVARVLFSAQAIGAIGFGSLLAHSVRIHER
ncbi:hypothetical protein H0X10_00130 [Candidatus Saccharibacteria bacterium]|nr:hypothetical protein [Candidatus Saccharibacteria bacterium]